MAIWMLLGLTLTLGAVLAVRLGGPHLRAVAILPFVGAFIPIFAPLLCRETHVLEVDGGPERSLLTASTWTGRRTVDLGRLVRVQRVIVPGRGTSLDMLVVTDVHGVRLGLTSSASRGALDCVLNLRGRSGVGWPNRPKITRRAQWELDSQRPPSFSAFLVWGFLVPLFFIVLWVTAVCVVCFPAALAHG
jgi:hypothetical protein